MIYVHFADGFEEIEAITAVDVLRRAGIETVSVSVTGDKTVQGSHEISVLTDILFEEADYGACEMIVLPGGKRGAENLLAHNGLADKIKMFADEKKYLAAICAAPMVLGKMGLLKGKNATIYPGMEENLAGAKATGGRIVIDENIITAKGAGTAMEFAFALVGILKSKEEAARLRKSMVAV